MRVFRVAHHTITNTVGRQAFPAGPYRFIADDETRACVLQHTQWDQHHPSPYEDPDLFTIGTYEVCGFVSEAALLDWFAGCLKELDDVGFRLWVYDVPDGDVRVGSLAGQLVFRASAADWVSMSRFPLDPEQLALFEPGDVLSGPGVRDNEAPADGQGTPSPDQ